MFFLKKLITPFLLPPGIFVLILSVFGLRALLKKHRKAGLCMLITAGCLWAVSLPLFADWMMGSLESDVAIPDPENTDVILLLGGALYEKAPDLSGTGAPGPDTLERMVTVARLYRRLKVPVVVSGGKVFKTDESIAKVTRRFLLDLGIPRKDVILEERSRDTYENALYCKVICQKKGFTNPLMVTSGYHIKRAKLSFEKVGLDITPFPCAITTWPGKRHGWRSFLPRAGALNTIYAALHEWMGLLYYQMRY